MLKKTFAHCFVLCLSFTLLTACQVSPKKVATPNATKVTQPAVKVKTRASSYVYLTPIPKEERTVYISLQNDAGTDAFDPTPWLIKSLEEKSFVIVDNIDKANVVLRARLFRVGKINNGDADALLNSEFGNSTQLLSLEASPGATQPLSNNDAVILDLQYFDRNELVDPLQVKPRSSMNNLTDTQLLLLCNTSRWERFQTRIIAITFENTSSQQEIFSVLGQSIVSANSDIVRGIS
jgi:hypothetical protein